MSVLVTLSSDAEERKKKSGYTSKAVELLHALRFQKDFMEDIVKVRESMKIPPEGMSSDMEISDDMRTGYRAHLRAGLDTIRKKYHLPPTHDETLENFIECNELEELTDPIDLIGFIDREAYDVEREVSYDPNHHAMARGFPFVQIVLFHNDREDAHRFIDEQWFAIEKLFEEHGAQKMPKKRKSSNKDRDMLILKFSKMSKKELGDEHAQYKNLLIVKKMAQVGYSMTESNIKRIIERIYKRG